MFQTSLKPLVGSLAYLGVDLIALIDGLRHRPGMWISDGSYQSVSTFLLGVEHAGELVGLQELIELKFGEPSNLHWVGLVPKIEPAIEMEREGADAAAVARLLDVVEELVTIDDAGRGYRRLMYEWVLMGQRQPWFDGTMERLRDPEADACVEVAATAELLSIDRSEVLQLIRSRTLRAERIGGSVQIYRSSIDEYLNEMQPPPSIA